MKALVLSILIASLMLYPIQISAQIQQPTNAVENQPFEKINKQLEETKATVSIARQQLHENLLEHEKLMEERRQERLRQEELEKEKELAREKEKTTEEIDYKTALKTLGYYRKDHKDDEINHRDAVIRFQSDHNLTVDGIFGPISKETLNKRLKDEKFQHPDIIDKPPTEGKWIVINKTKRILTLYNGGKVIHKYPIAQGKTANLTPEGKFTIVTKAINPAWGGAGVAAPVAGGAPNNPLGTRWLGLSHGGGGRYGIHGNSSPRSIGTDASLGCVRMINSDVEALYNLVPVRTIVWIGTEEQLKEWGVNKVSYLENNPEK